MIQVKNNFTGAVALFKTLTQAHSFFCKALASIGHRETTKKQFIADFKKNKRFKVGFGNISVVVSEANSKKVPKK